MGDEQADGWLPAGWGHREARAAGGGGSPLSRVPVRCVLLSQSLLWLANRFGAEKRSQKHTM